MFYQQPWINPDEIQSMQQVQQPAISGYLNMPPKPEGVGGFFANPFIGALGAGISAAAAKPGTGAFGVGFQNAMGNMQNIQRDQIKNQYQALQMQAMLQKMEQESQERQAKQQGAKALLDYLNGQGRSPLGSDNAGAQTPTQSSTGVAAQSAAAFQQLATTSPQQAQLAQIAAAMGNYDKALDIAIKSSAGGDPSYTQPVAGVDAQGNPVYFQADKAGNLKVINGIRPNQQNPLSKAMLDSDQKKLDRVTESADNAQSLISNIQNFRNALGKFETGTGAGLKLQAGQLDQSVLGGAFSNRDSVAAGEAIKNFGTSFVLNFVQQTKGAISDNEMKTFTKASPGIENTRAGNERIANAMEASAQRTVEKANFLRAYIENNGSLSGSEAAWRKFVNENPIIDKDFNLNLNNVGSWQNYLNSGYKKSNTNTAQYSQPATAAQTKNPAEQQVQSLQDNQQRVAQLQSLAQDAINRGANPQQVQARLQQQLKSLGI